MADNNSKKYLDKAGLSAYTQQLKNKLDETYSTFEYVDDNKFSGDYNDLENKPCYTSTEPVQQVFFEETECTFTETFVGHIDGTRTYYYTYSIDFPKTFVPGDTYTVIIDGTQYENLISYIPENSSYSSGAIGSDDSPHFADGYPFHIEAFDYLGNTLSFQFSKEFYGEGNLVHTIAIYHISPEVKLLDTKYTANKPGLAVAGQELKLYDYEMDEQTEETVVAGIGAEIFNNLKLNVASGDYSHAEGGVTTASGSYSHAEGNNTTASGLWGSHAEGTNTIASASAAHAEGSNTVASGPWGSHAEGEGTIASGWASHAEGCNTVASKGYSHAEGYGTLASSSYQHVQGKYNIEDNASTYAHIVGNGTHDGYNENGDAIITRSNAHTLDWDGNAWFAGNVTVGEDNKELTTKEYVDTVSNNTNTMILDMYQKFLRKDSMTQLGGDPYGNTSDLGVFNMCKLFVNEFKFDGEINQTLNETDTFTNSTYNEDNYGFINVYSTPEQNGAGQFIRLYNKHKRTSGQYEFVVNIVTSARNTDFEFFIKYDYEEEFMLYGTQTEKPNCSYTINTIRMLDYNDSEYIDLFIRFKRRDESNYATIYELYVLEEGEVVNKEYVDDLVNNSKEDLTEEDIDTMLSDIFGTIE